jgi:hypothetical protein
LTNSLIKRRKELHEPDRMHLNPNSIAFVEPLGTSSKVAQLIEQPPHQAISEILICKIWPV